MSKALYMKRRRKIQKCVAEYVLAGSVDSDSSVTFSSCSPTFSEGDLNEDLKSYHEDHVVYRDILDGFDRALFSENDDVDLTVTEPLTEADITTQNEVNEEDKSLACDLARWAIGSNATVKDVTNLLKVLRTHGMTYLPADARTLLQTPRSVNVVEKCGGQYYYFGLSNKIEAYCRDNPLNEVDLMINIDGLPLYKSSNCQLWPILCAIKTSRKPQLEPFLVALYSGMSKPNPVKHYLEDFLSELSTLCQNGVNIGDKSCSVNLMAFVCDAPARAWLKCVKLHTAYNSCERCTVHGHYEAGRVTLLDLSAPLRTDEMFFQNKYHDHQDAVSPLAEVFPHFGLVTGFLLDYMHLICLGVMRRLLYFWSRGPKKFGRLSFTQISLISEDAVSQRKLIPSDFARKPRSLKELDRWKATEFRLFLLYIGPVILKRHLNKEHYENFLCFSLATSILLSNTKPQMVEYARQLMICFVSRSAKLYGNAFVVYNVHNLIHVADDVLKYNCTLNKLSCFPFENYLQKLKKMIRSVSNPVAQIAKRMTEMEVICNEMTSTSDAARLSPCEQIDIGDADNCYLLTNGNVCFVREIWENGKLRVDILPKCHLQNWFQTPCDSSKMNIFSVGDADLRKMNQKEVLYHDLSKKLVHLAIEKSHVFLPLLKEN
jgi:hypothetical protein